MKTTSPDKYKVRPSMNNLAPGVSDVVEIVVQSHHAGAPAHTYIRDRFLLTVNTVDRDGMTYEEISDLTKVRVQSKNFNIVSTINFYLQNARAILIYCLIDLKDQCQLKYP